MPRTMMRLRHPAALGFGPLIGAGLGLLVGLVLVLAIGDRALTSSFYGREWASFVGIALRLLVLGATTLAGGLLGLIVGTILAPPPYNVIGALFLLALFATAGGWWILRAPQRRENAFLNAVQRGKHAEIQRMLAEGFPIDRSISGRSALLWSLEWHNLDSARFLVQKGANVNVIQPGKGSALYLAAATGDVELVREMLRHGADPSLSDHGRDIRELLSHSATWPAPDMRAVLEGAVKGETSRKPVAR